MVRYQHDAHASALAILISVSNMSSQPVALITGASRGIGRAVAELLAENGYAVGVNFVRNESAAAEVVMEVVKCGGTAVAIQGDVGDSNDRQRMIDETLAAFDRIDLLVNNAGITSPGRKELLAATEENWDTVMNTNLKGAFFLAQRAASEMIKLKSKQVISRGTIVNVSSISAYAVSTNRVDYCIAKAGLQMMTWQLATGLADENIRVFEVCPGVIASDMTKPVKEKYDRLIAEGLSPIRRWGLPDDVARAVLALAGDSFPFSTGDRINVDGGFHIRRL